MSKKADLKSSAAQIDLEEFIFDRGAAAAVLDGRGREIPDPTPMAPPIGYRPPVHMTDLIRQTIRSERLAQEAREAQMETFDEADDFDIPDDPVDPSTPWEELYDPQPAIPAPRTAYEELQAGRPHVEQRENFKRNPPAPRQQRAAPAAPEAAPAASTAPPPPSPRTPPASGS